MLVGNQSVKTAHADTIDSLWRLFLETREMHQQFLP